jgi:hypothetical protein
MDEIEKEKLKDSLYATVITGLTWYFITQDERAGLLGGISGGITTYTQHDKLNPFIIRIKKSQDPTWWITNWNSEKIKTPIKNITVIDKEISAGDVARYTLAPFTFGLSLRL